MQLDVMTKMLDSIQAQIRAFDTKAQVALGIDSLTAGLVGTQLVRSTEYGANGMHWRYGITLLLSAASLVFLAISFYWGIRCVHPQLHLAQPRSHFFFCHLVEMYGQDFQKSANAVMSLGDDTARFEVGTQIHTNAVICDTKGKRSSRAILFGSFALAAYLLTVIPFVSMSYDAGTKIKRPIADCAAQTVIVK